MMTPINWDCGCKAEIEWKGTNEAKCHVTSCGAPDHTQNHLDWCRRHIDQVLNPAPYESPTATVVGCPVCCGEPLIRQCYCYFCGANCGLE